MKQAVQSMFIWVVGTALTFLLFLAMAFFSIILYPFDRKRKIAHAQCYWWCDLLTALNPYWDVTVEGLEHIDHHETYVVVSNHQSIADIVLMYKTKMQFKWVAKESLFKIPILGWNMLLAKHIQLKRGDFTSIKKAYREASQWLRQRISVVFFPEGTRSEVDEMGTFQNGAFKLAIKEKVPVLPVIIEGTRDAIPKGSWRFTTKISIAVRVLEPIETTSYLPADFGRLRDVTKQWLSGPVDSYKNLTIRV